MFGEEIVVCFDVSLINIILNLINEVSRKVDPESVKKNL